MGHFKGCGDIVSKGADASLYKAKALLFAKLEASIKKQLHTETYSHKRLTLCGKLFYMGHKSCAFKLVHSITESAYTGQNYLIRFGQHLGITGDDSLCSYFLKRRAKGKQISHAIINDCYHSTPFVEGISPDHASDTLSA